MNGQIFAGREISVVVAAETRKRPEEMRHKARVRGPVNYGGRRSTYYGRSRSRSVSRSRSPHYRSGSRSRYQSRSYSPAPRQRGDYSVSPRRHPVRDYSVSPRRHPVHSRSPRGPPGDRDGDKKRRSYSPGYGNGPDYDQSNGYDKKPMYDSEGARDQWGQSPRRTPRSPVGSRSRSADLSPRRGR